MTTFSSARRSSSAIRWSAQEESAHVKSCMPVIPSADLDKSLRFWVEGLGLTMDRAMRRDGRLIGCMVHNEITDRDYGQTEFFVTDDDGYSHCFGVATTKGG
jgi:hypothetical protein